MFGVFSPWIFKVGQMIHTFRNSHVFTWVETNHQGPEEDDPDAEQKERARLRRPLDGVEDWECRNALLRGGTDTVGNWLVM